MSIEETVIKIISEQMGVNTESVTPDTHLEDDLGADSLDAVEHVMELEDEFVISINDVEAEKWKTVQDVLDTVNKLVNEE